MAEADLSAQKPSGNISLLPSPFEEWATDNGYNIAPAVAPSNIRQYADRQTQAAFDAWNAGAQSVARIRLRHLR